MVLEFTFLPSSGAIFFSIRLLKNGHQSRASRDFPHPRPVRCGDRFWGEVSKDICFQMGARTVRILSNGASRCNVQPTTPHSSRGRVLSTGFRLPARSRFGEGRGAPAKRDFAKLNLHLPAEASAQAGAFLSSLRRMTFPAGC